MSVFDERHSFFKGSLGDEIKEMVDESLHKSSKAFLRSLKLVKAIATQRPDQRVTVVELAKRWARFNLETSRVISRHSQKVVDELLDALERYGFYESTFEQPAFADNQKKTQPKMVIGLSARRGEKVKASFIVANPGNEEMEATFAVTDFVNEDDHVVSKVEVQFSPTNLKLPPNQEAPVHIIVKVNHKFRVNKVYFARLMLPGHTDKEIILKLQVLSSKRTKSRTSKARKPSKKDVVDRADW
jgi:hypothetical protein